MTGYSMRSVRFEIPGRFRHINHSGYFCMNLICFPLKSSSSKLFFSMKSHPDIARFGLIFTDIASEYLARDPSEISQVRAGRSFGKMLCGFVDVEPGTCNLHVKRSRGSNPICRPSKNVKFQVCPLGLFLVGGWNNGAQISDLYWRIQVGVFVDQNLEIWVFLVHAPAFRRLLFWKGFWGGVRKLQFDEIVKTTFVVEEVPVFNPQTWIGFLKKHRIFHA